MSKPIVDLSGEKFNYVEDGTDKPVYTIYAKNERAAYKQLTKFLEKIGKLSSLELMKRID